MSNCKIFMSFYNSQTLTKIFGYGDKMPNTITLQIYTCKNMSTYEHVCMFSVKTVYV